MKKLITAALLMFATTAIAQTNATNWTAQDCNSTSHTLFDELNSGKVIVFAWVMPCGSCVAPSKTAYDAVQTFATSNPDKVLFYMADDLGDANCSTLTSWVTSSSIGNTSKMTIFSNSGNVIDENDFGGTGMPHIIVMGGPNHEIFFNKKNTAANDATGITSAINSALTAASIGSLNNEISFSISPNPVTESFVVNYTKPVQKVTVTSVNGQIIKEEVFPKGKINPAINLSQVAAGIYVIKVTGTDDKTGVQKLVKE